MEIRSYNLELAYANLMFSNIFRNITITKVVKGKDKDVKVNCVLGQRSRILKNLQNKNKEGTIKLPLIAINRTGYSRNAERLNNINNEVKQELTSKYRKTDLLTPVPIDIEYEVAVMAKSPSDIDQIASNFMVFFNSDVYVSCKHPKYNDIILNNQIIMGDQVTEDHPDDIDGTTDDFITSTFSFTFKTYLFGGTQKSTPRMTRPVISSYLSTYTEKEVKALTSVEEISAWLSSHEGSYVSGFYEVQVTKELTTTVISGTGLSDDLYDGFVPIVNTLCIGLYPIDGPLSSAEDWMTSVDNVLSVKYPYVSRMKWIIDPNSTAEFPDNFIKERVDPDGYFAQSSADMICAENDYYERFANLSARSLSLGLSTDQDRVFIPPISAAEPW